MVRDDRARGPRAAGTTGRYAGENGDDLQGRGGAGTGLVGRSIDAQVEISGRLASLVGVGAALVVRHDGRIHGAARRVLRQGTA